MHKLNFAAASDRGLMRGNNEDSAYAGPNLLALADGMGGHVGGEIASQIMIAHIRELDRKPEPGEDMRDALAVSAARGNAEIAERVAQDPDLSGMGTTLTALKFDGETFAMCHVGDSRGYRLREGKLEQITVDDTYVQSLVNEGKLNKDDIPLHPMRSYILKAYTGQEVEPTLTLIDAHPGDRLLLCSDGLSDPVTHDTIEEALSQGTPQEAANKLIELALRSGGPDNVTVVVCDVVEDTQQAPIQSVTAGAPNGERQDPRPDTAASRAAQMQDRQPREIAPNSEAQPEPEPERPAETSRASKSKRLFTALAAALVVLIILVGAGLFAWKKAQDSYFVTTNGDQIVVDKGLDYTIFGKPLHHQYQQACLSNKDGSLTMTDDDSPADCTPLKVKDLKESARGQVTGGHLPGGSYNDVLGQMQALAGEALPKCLKTQDKGAALKGDLTTPGVNCREVK